MEEADQITHDITLEEKCDPQNMLNVFQFDQEYAANEEAWKRVQKEILGEGDEVRGGCDPLST